MKIDKFWKDQRINCRSKNYSMYEWYNHMRIEKLSADGTVTEFGDGIGICSLSKYSIDWRIIADATTIWLSNNRSIGR